ncbi:basic endochitinase C-like [Carya illinoinensis]|uniref:chitinase n=1 Tax=Carya illinoinensis TaxID=32201 RepID=A0A922ET32_CARIL|nr:basic endochitinase C-like [Carya illinoinensis]KAG6709684.1 hypothetical protein I3842_06G145500 [Carya illinoinensis]
MNLVSWILFLAFVLARTSGKHAYRFPEGECGKEAEYTPCRDGYCCSNDGWCGNTDDYCSPGHCQSQCPTSPPPPSPPPPPPPIAPPPPPIVPPPPPFPEGECGKEAEYTPCRDGYCCSNDGWCGNTDDYCSPGHCQSQCPATPPPPPPPSPIVPTPAPAPAPAQASNPTSSGDDVSSIITPSLFDKLLLHRNDLICESTNGFYSYDAFLAAARSFTGFGTTGDVDTRKREIAAFLAQTSYETAGGWADAPNGAYAWRYCFITEINKLDYCTETAETANWPCAPGKQYYGRGPIQLTYNYNYGQAGEALGYDLLNNPDLVATDPTISFKTAIWFWMTAQENKPSSHDVITGKWVPSAADMAASRVPGYGVITNIINGGVECGHGSNDKVANRIGFYKSFCDAFGISYGDNLDCYNQRPFGYTAIRMHVKYLKNHIM